jgi:NAD(P)-dependent dehydrogenase (short-subunit alcohol dehydrogenase family)
MKSFADPVQRTALITGGSRGIGLAIARELANSHKHIILVARDEKKLKSEVLELRRKGLRSDYVAVDFFDPNYLGLIDEYLKLNDFKPTILINGLGGGFGSKTLDSLDKYEEIMRLNFFAAVNLTQYISAYALTLGFGRFIYLGTLAVNHKSTSAPYVAAKSALIAYMKMIAKTFAEIDDNIVAAAISPGAINVEGKYLNKLYASDREALNAFLKVNRVSAGRLGSPHEVAKVVAFLCGEESNYLHGCNIEIDGAASN